MRSAITEYNKVNVAANVEDADAHKLIQMLMTGVLEKLTAAKVCMAHENIAEKGLNISIAISILDGLQASLDREQGGELADNLFRLYTYMMEKLVAANLHNKPDEIDEVIGLMTTIKEGWDGIRKQALEQINQPEKAE